MNRYFKANASQSADTDVEFFVTAFSDNEPGYTEYFVMADGTILVEEQLDRQLTADDYAWFAARGTYTELLTDSSEKADDELLMLVLRCIKRGIDNIDDVPAHHNPFAYAPAAYVAFLLDADANDALIGPFFGFYQID